MNDSEYKLMSEAQYRHWWWLGRRKIIENLIESQINLSKKLSIVDLGCGFGANISMLRQYGDVLGLDMHREAIDQIKRQWEGSVNVREWVFPEKINEKFDLIILADVLEHIPLDKKMTSWIYDHLKYGGYAIVTVPAYKFLWTQMDDVVHHLRRYNKKQLVDLFKDKFEIKKFSFYNFFLFPVKFFFLVVVKLMRKLKINNMNRSYNDIILKKPLALINLVFKYILYLESEIIPKFSLPLGVSMIILVQKKNGDKNNL